MDAKAIDFLARLVAAKSVSSKDPSIDSSNKEAASVVATMLEEAGMRVEMLEVPGLVDKHNVVALAGPDEPGTGLLLAGHTDTVPCDPDRWETDPFKLSERDGCLRGLGACDMKGFFAAIFLVLREIDLGALDKPLRVWATAEEECGMEGAMHLTSCSSTCAAALVGEPTGVTPVRGHKGGLADRIVCLGKAGHASMPGEGANALEAVGKIMAELRQDHESIAAERSSPVFDPPEPTLNFGLCNSGDAFNRIPDRAELWVDRRILPGEQVAEVRERIRLVAREAAAQVKGVSVEFGELVKGFEPMLTSEDAPIVKEAVRLTGRGTETVAYGTEAPYYAAAGMDALVMGAGDIGFAHKADERVAIAEIDRMAEVTRGLVESLCASG